MHTEIEVKFLHTDHDAVRASLKSLGAVCEKPMRLMRRAMLDDHDQRFQKNFQDERLRVRDEGDKVTVTYKKQRDDSDYVYEAEVIVNSFDDMLEFFKALGYSVYSFQESKRETWEYQGVEIVLDEWPWLKPYIEIEGATEDAIKDVAKALGFSWDDARFGSVDTAYQADYPGMSDQDSVGRIAEVRFDTPVDQYLLDRQKS